MRRTFGRAGLGLGAGGRRESASWPSPSPPHLLLAEGGQVERRGEGGGDLLVQRPQQREGGRRERGRDRRRRRRAQGRGGGGGGGGRGRRLQRRQRPLCDGDERRAEQGQSAAFESAEQLLCHQRSDVYVSGWRWARPSQAWRRRLRKRLAIVDPQAAQRVSDDHRGRATAAVRKLKLGAGGDAEEGRASRWAGGRREHVPPERSHAAARSVAASSGAASCRQLLRRPAGATRSDCRAGDP